MTTSHDIVLINDLVHKLLSNTISFRQKKNPYSDDIILDKRIWNLKDFYSKDKKFNDLQKSKEGLFKIEVPKLDRIYTQKREINYSFDLWKNLHVIARTFYFEYDRKTSQSFLKAVDICLTKLFGLHPVPFGAVFYLYEQICHKENFKDYLSDRNKLEISLLDPILFSNEEITLFIDQKYVPELTGFTSKSGEKDLLTTLKITELISNLYLCALNLDSEEQISVFDFVLFIMRDISSSLDLGSIKENIDVVKKRVNRSWNSHIFAVKRLKDYEEGKRWLETMKFLKDQNKNKETSNAIKRLKKLILSMEQSSSSEEEVSSEKTPLKSNRKKSQKEKEDNNISSDSEEEEDDDDDDDDDDNSSDNEEIRSSKEDNSSDSEDNNSSKDDSEDSNKESNKNDEESRKKMKKTKNVPLPSNNISKVLLPSNNTSKVLSSKKQQKPNNSSSDDSSSDDDSSSNNSSNDSSNQYKMTPRKDKYTIKKRKDNSLENNLKRKLEEISKRIKKKDLDFVFRGSIE